MAPSRKQRSKPSGQTKPSKAPSPSGVAKQRRNSQRKHHDFCANQHLKLDSEDDIDELSGGQFGEDLMKIGGTDLQQTVRTEKRLQHVGQGRNGVGKIAMKPRHQGEGEGFDEEAKHTAYDEAYDESCKNDVGDGEPHHGMDNERVGQAEEDQTNLSLGDNIAQSLVLKRDLTQNHDGVENSNQNQRALVPFHHGNEQMEQLLAEHEQLKLVNENLKLQLQNAVMAETVRRYHAERGSLLMRILRWIFLKSHH
jgi:hypothetical protein